MTYDVRGGVIAEEDHDRIEQVLLNLLDNAIKYSRPAGIVSLAIEPGDPLRVRVKDQGIGIPADDLARSGERFYQADKARARAKGGSGLGLAIAQALIAAHGGTLQIDSEEDRGTVVSFTLARA